MGDTVLYEREGRIATITYNRPEALNAINGELRADLNAAWEQFRQDDEAWETARRARTTAAVNAYLEAWPTGRHVDAARELAAGLQAEREDARAFEAARKLDTRAAYQAYLDAFPRGDHVAAALEAIDDLTLRPGKVFRDCPDCQGWGTIYRPMAEAKIMECPRCRGKGKLLTRR